MRRGRLFAALAAALLAGAAAASPCDQVAVYARRLPDSAWVRGEAALEPLLRIEKGRPTNGLAGAPPAASPLELKIAADPAVAKAIGADGNWTVFVEHAPGTDLYAAFTVQGTLHCQDLQLVRAGAGAEIRLISDPQASGDGADCWTQSEDVGAVRGAPAIVTHGRRSSTSFDQEITITPWTSPGWGPTCRLALSFRSRNLLGRRYCGDAVACRDGTAAAAAIAQAFDERLERGDDKTPFRFGEPPESLVTRAAALKTQTNSPTPEFPTFGKATSDRPDWSSADFTWAPVTIGGHAYLAGIGTEGIGWRESDLTLIALYDPTAPGPKPLAAFEVTRVPAALRAATVLPAKAQPASR